ncbi:hypothetical protein B0I12_000070 [Microbacterium hydrothermale]|uniref:hypothetical protein n=1 Tax=Microbacterium hydrothermale TaxID=857427 RepID=UPI002226DF5C|nr:hypothetical protein [Microbacterium hydrothermale]MCW2162944.1 hypothetical protein [Microbacterium hydrothermale]
MTDATTFDPTPLTAPVDRKAAQAFSAQLRREGKLGGTLVPIIVFALVGAVFLFIAVPVFATVASSVFSRGSSGPLPLLFVVFFLIVASFIVGAIVRAFGGAAERRYRLDRFARANGMTWHPGIDDPALPGMIFDLGHDRESRDLVRAQNPRFVEVGNYRYETGSGKNKQTHRWGYVAVRLDTPLPHMVLDAVGNNGLFGASNLPVTFGRGQRLSLEGDFDRHFALYCPEGYERDALYLFTPDVMARFIDNAAALDVEIIDDWLFLYARRDLSTLDPATWRWLFATVAAIDDKLAQWARWRDERLAAETPSAAPTAGAAASGIPGEASALLTPPPVGVAREGRRLRRGFSWVGGVIAVLAIGWWLLTVVTDIFVR